MAVKDTGTGAKVKVGSFSPPASYTTGGVALDLTADFSWLGYVNLEIETAGSIVPMHVEMTLNQDTSGAAPGKALIKFVRERYDRPTMGNVTSLPGGVAAQAAKFAAATTTGSSHTHTINHDHPSTTSSTPVAGGNGVDAVALSVAIASHTHAVDVAAFTGSTAAATHTHDRSFEYEHDHSLAANTATDATSIELAAGTDWSTTVFRYMAVGF